MTRYLLDTNIVSHFLRGHRAVDRVIVAHAVGDLCISAVTAGEILFGLSLRPAGSRYAVAARRFMVRVDILPWDKEAADVYGPLRAELQRAGTMLAEMDLLIASHALAVGAVLVTNDQAMLRLPGLETEDWTRDV